MPKLLLGAKISSTLKEQKLSVAAAAKAMGVGAPGLAAVIKGKSKPNAATLPKYAKFLGLPAEEVAALAGRKPEAGGKKAGRRSKATNKAKASPKMRRNRRSTGVTLQDAVALANDPLAVAIHRADASTRDVISRLIN